MYVLGYSGLDGIIDFRKNNIPLLDERELGMCQGMDAAAALIKDGKIIAAAEEERFIDNKHTCQFPINAIQYSLDKAKIDIQDVDAICHGFNFLPFREIYLASQFNRKLYETVLSNKKQQMLFKQHWPLLDIEKKLKSIDHHLAHAASAFYPSSFNHSLVIVADGIGELYSLSGYIGDQSKIETLFNYDMLSSVGILYSIFTMYLGFYPNNDECKIMGLAPYGDETIYKTFFDELIQLLPKGKLHIPCLLENQDIYEKQTYRGTLEFLEKHLGEIRKPNHPFEKRHQDIVAALQVRINQAILNVVEYWKRITQSEYLCLAGGVTLNCVINSAIYRKKLFKRIFVQPAAGDAGTALGAAMYYYNLHSHQRYYYTEAEQLPFYGPNYVDNDVEQAIQKYSNLIVKEKMSLQALSEIAADMIAKNKVIAWMQGNMEYGPRALGHRSILANPLDPNARDIVNKMVKKRGAFKPFAPSVKLEKAHHYFEIEEDDAFPFMLFTVKVKESYRKVFPAITHVDDSARIQTVKKETHPNYWQLIDKVEARTGHPILLNTSFNVKGQAMVCNPDQAISTFLSTKLDALFIGNYLIKKVI